MLTSKKTILKPLFESTNGLHLTAYLINRGDLVDLKSQLRDIITQTYEWLNPVMSIEDRNKFLEPLDSLLEDASIFKEMKGNIGIFRNQASFRLLNIPIEVEQACQVATSFHVKPLLKWLQSDQEFLLLGLEKEAAHLYLGNQSSFKLVESILLPEALKGKEFNGGYQSLKDSRTKRTKEGETIAWLNEWISELTRTTKPKLFVAGEKSFVSRLGRKLRYKNVAKAPIADLFVKNNVSDICSSVRRVMRAEAKEYVEKSIFEFRLAEEGNRVQKNIFQISRAVVQGRVRKLLVTDELNIFGKIDKKSGGIAIHPFDLDHEDDDILDDLAQMVLSQGGEVIVASKNEIPSGRAILAILDDGGKELAKTDNIRLATNKDLVSMRDDVRNYA
ncbi:MAG: hypothetical protein J0M15_08945 [Deltaproteobacteria bacterium]|jgi:hypothetical protein|nr:hypothetical protein [Deltaproteobacteria bacterium]